MNLDKLIPYKEQLRNEFASRFGSFRQEVAVSGQSEIMVFSADKYSAIVKELAGNGFEFKESHGPADFYYNSVLGAYVKKTDSEVRLNIYIKH